VKAKADYNRANQAALREAYESLMAAKVPALYYIPGQSLYGTDGEGSTDNAHANDLGFMRMAEVMLPVIREALGS